MKYLCLIVIAIMITGLCFAGETYIKKSDTEVEIKNFETTAQISPNSPPSKAVIETVSIPLKDLKVQLDTLKSRNNAFEAQVTELRARYQAEVDLTQKRIDEAVKLGVVEVAKEKKE